MACRSCASALSTSGAAGQGRRDSDETRAYVQGEVPIGAVAAEVVDQRQKTIYKVATSIINFQKDSSTPAISILNRRVAGRGERTSACHESTVSRVVNNKYMRTPQACSR